MSEYTPSVERVRRGWIHHRRLVTRSKARGSGEEFDRMIAEVAREAEARALEGAANDLRRPGTGAGYDAWASGVGDWLRARAAEVREGKTNA